MISTNYESYVDILNSSFSWNQAVSDAVIMYLDGPFIQKTIIPNINPNNIID